MLEVSHEWSRHDRFVADGGSFRDRSNRVYDDGVRIWRGIDASAYGNWMKLSDEPFFKALVEAGKVVETELVPAEQVRAVDGLCEWPAVLSHERIPFISYPYEWSFGMLRDAALLHLEILESALVRGWILKDASSFNVQWKGSEPVFIDTPSFVLRAPGAAWVGYRQFCMMFLFPLMLHSYKGVDHIPLLRSMLEGIEPTFADRILGGFSRFRRGVLGHVYLQARLQRRALARILAESAKLVENGGQEFPTRPLIKHSHAMVIGLVQSLRRIITKMPAPRSPSIWQGYATRHSYEAQSFEQKIAFIRQHTAQKKWGMIWDLGCNTGTFSDIAAKYSDIVVSMDSDNGAIENLYQNSKKRGISNIVPIIADIANPSPSQGWRGVERKSIESRAKPELVLCLALIHHLVISANIPLPQVIDWLRKLGGDVIVEFVSKDDAMVQLLLRNRVDQYSDYSETEFERLCTQFFEIAASLAIKGGTRKVYYLKQRPR